MNASTWTMRTTAVFRMVITALAATSSMFWLGCGTDPLEPGDPSDLQLGFEVVVGGLRDPIFLSQPNGDDRLFVAEQPGRIVIVENGQIRATPFLDIENQVGCCGERGLLGLAFHPDYASNGLFYVSYTDNGGDSRIERYRVSSDPDVADAGSQTEILSLAQPFANHNGGMISFGPDEMLYVGFGDGGSGGDPLGSGQDLSTLLGTILRIDVDGGAPYGIPADNPFVNTPQARAEIWLYGLRNPWRFSFDEAGGQIWIGDVGQNEWEEISVLSTTDGGANLGWNIMEGAHCFQAGSCDMSGLVLPVAEYANPGEGCAVVGGYVYRGTAIPELQGHYLYSDFCGRWVRSFAYHGGAATNFLEWGVLNGAPLSFSIDAVGEIYVLTGAGQVLKIVEVGATPE